MAIKAFGKGRGWTGQMKKIQFGSFLMGISALAMVLMMPGSELGSFSVAEKAQKRRLEIIRYLRYLKPMVYNFPCEPFPDCFTELKKQDKLSEAPRARLFFEIKRVYQEGMVYYFEGNYINAYNRFLDAQMRTDNLMEGISQSYLNRTEIMLRDSIEKWDQKNPADMSVVDISIEYGANSHKRRDFNDLRESPHTTRRYDPKEVHWAVNKFSIEKNVEKGYAFLGLAHKARNRAVQVDRHLRKKEKTSPDQRKKRIDLYIATVKICRRAKFNAAMVFQLKYPYKNYALSNVFGKTEKDLFDPEEVPKLENVRMNWTENPYVLPKALHPVFDMRLPAKFRRDITDGRNMIYEEEVDILIRMKYYKEKPKSYQQDGGNSSGG